MVSCATVVEPRYKMTGEFNDEGIAAVVDDTGWAYIDRSGRVLIRPFVYDNGPDYFSEGLARFRRDGKFGFFDTAGRVVIEPRFEWVEPFQDNRARFGTDCETVSTGEHHMVRCAAWDFFYLDPITR